MGWIANPVVRGSIPPADSIFSGSVMVAQGRFRPTVFVQIEFRELH